MMAQYASILFGMIIANNFVLVKFLGICPFLGVSKRLDSSVGMGLAVTLVMVLATAATWPLQRLLELCGIGYLQTIVFILVIAALVQFVEMVLKKFIPALHKALGVYLPLITTNCAVLGVCINNIDLGYNYPQSLVNSFGAGVGFLLAMLIFSGMRQKLENNNKVPKPFQGVPITMTTAALLSLAFMGFGGLV